MEHDYRDHIDEIWNQSKNVHRIYKIFTLNLVNLQLNEWRAMLTH